MEVSGGRICLFFGCLMILGDNAECLGLRCRPGWIKHGQSCYMFDSTRQHKRQDAIGLCQSFGSYLVAPQSAEENQFVHGLFVAETDWPQLWLAFEIRRGSVNGSLVCPNTTGNGERLNYCNLYQGSEAEEGCGVMSRTGQWKSKPCGHLKFTMCEHRATGRCSPSPACRAVKAREYGEDYECRLFLNHTLAVLEAAHPVQCCIACLEDPQCRSFNLLDSARCVLNNATVSQMDLAALPPYVGECAYYEV